MPILIDTTTLQVHKAASSVQCLEHWAEILVPVKHDFMIAGCNERDLGAFDDLDLQTDQAPHVVCRVGQLAKAY